MGQIYNGVSVTQTQGNDSPTGDYLFEDVPHEEKTVVPTAAGVEVKPSARKYLSNVVVNGDENLVAENIKKDVTIFGITGTYEG